MPPQTLSEITGPVFGSDDVKPTDHDLTRQHKGEPIGERIIVTRPRARRERQAGAAHAGRDLAGQRRRPLSAHASTSTTRRSIRTSPAPAARVTDADGRYRFVTIRPGEYPWRNHYNAWRPAHIHFSLFGQAFLTRLVTQMYFPGDPLLPYDPMFNCIAERGARASAWCRRSTGRTPSPSRRSATASTSCCAAATQTPMEKNADEPLTPAASRPSGRTCTSASTGSPRATSPAAASRASASRSQGRVIDGDGEPASTTALVEIWQANAAGKYAHPEDTQNKPLERGWRGFGRIPTDAKGAFRFTTIKPGRVPGPDGKLQAPHLVVAVFMRGLLKHLATRIYFPDEPAQRRGPDARSWCRRRGARRWSPRRSGKNAPGVEHASCRARTKRCSSTSEPRAPVRGRSLRRGRCPTRSCWRRWRASKARWRARRRGRPGAGAACRNHFARVRERAIRRRGSGARRPHRHARHSVRQAADRAGRRDSPEAARHVHAGATSQDVIDTGAVLCLQARLRAASQSSTHSTGQCGRRARAAACRARRRPRAPCCSPRSPVTFGWKAAVWLSMLSRSLAGTRGAAAASLRPAVRRPERHAFFIRRKRDSRAGGAGARARSAGEPRAVA